MSVTHTIIDSPLGDLTLVGDNGALSGLYFERHWYLPDRAGFGRRSEEGFAEATEQLGQYFAGERTRFELRADARGDGFQHRVWDLLARIPYGETRTYGDLARELGDASLARDVGAAVATNPLCIIVPCHRVIGASGNLTGYAGGLRRKRCLLDLEERVARLPRQPTWLHSVARP